MSVQFKLSPLLAVERGSICELCGKAFRSNSQLIAHARMVHSDERPYKCPTCGLRYVLVYSFTHVSHSKLVYKTHCTVCLFLFRFKLSSLLGKHRKTHIESQFKCDQCGKQFRSINSLNYHLESHTGVIAKPFACDFCPSTFRMNRHLQVCIHCDIWL